MNGFCLTGTKISGGAKKKAAAKKKGLTEAALRAKPKRKTTPKNVRLNRKKPVAKATSPKTKKKAGGKKNARATVTMMAADIKTEEMKKTKPQPQEKKITIKWNHYTETFNFEDPPGLKLAEVDKLFYASESYPKCRIHLQPVVNKREWSLESRVREIECEAGVVFTSMPDKGTFYLEIEEDKEQVELENRRAVDLLKARAQENKKNFILPNAQSRDITNQLKAMSTDELRNRSMRFQTLKEARDIEDVMNEML